ncbi:MAG: hypothetical protein COA96_03210 [SAR86 cluster bacterium]|uniref:Uncharacterized protein n=1 Tax=SAR86 cluster bacterium TaxID=2030880 RepID=A0A2A5B7P5_9GAMM|nr:MAG: hypothetical protein COA96_03210 [SAR86 cluster bacterium]
MQFEIDITSEHKILFYSVREVLLENYGLNEIQKSRITTYSDNNGGICHMRTMKHGIDLGFLKGIHMEDKYGLLSGSGKLMRILSMSKLNITEMKYYVDQAVAINSSKK